MTVMVTYVSDNAFDDGDADNGEHGDGSDGASACDK